MNLSDLDQSRLDSTQPLLSILVPLFNREWCIADCLASIQGLKESQAEVVVVDDGSTDRSALHARSAIEALGITGHVRLVEQPNGGPGAARNRAAAEARGKWLVFLDSDDLWLPWTLKALTQVLGTAESGTELLFLRILTFADAAELANCAWENPKLSDHASFLEAVEARPEMRYGTCNAAIRRDVFQRVGGFYTHLRCSEDTDLFLRVAGPTRVVSQPVLAGLRRSGQDSLTSDARSVIEGFKWLAKANHRGLYPGSPSARRTFLARSCAYSVRKAFAAGRLAAAYSLYARNLRLLLDARTRKYVVRLPLTPLLHLSKPQAYPFRFRPPKR